MAINPHFNHTSFTTEQNLLQDLIDESIQVYGHDVFYIRRDVVNMDTLLGEDDLQLFQAATPIEMYIKTHASFQGQSEFVSKFGLIIEDRVDLSCSVRRFHSIFPAMLRPREGDLIWIQMAPESRYLFEIRFVENQEQLFQLGKLYTYELRCERMNFSHERVRTNFTEINEGPERDAYTLDIFVTGGSINYQVGETVFQGDNPITGHATGRVLHFTSNVGLLSVQDVTGVFGTGPIIGANSGAVWTSTTVPSTAPESHDPISDNQELQETGNTVVVVRGTNPRFN
jgi:hypothetical protein